MFRKAKKVYCKVRVSISKPDRQDVDQCINGMGSGYRTVVAPAVLDEDAKPLELRGCT